MNNNDQQLRLLNPGPVTLTQRVRQALTRPDVCHREREFTRLMDDVRDGLRRVYPQAQNDYEAVLFTGSGTSAMEAMVGSLVPRQGKALVLANGVYGERMANMLRTQGKTPEVIQHHWTSGLNLEEVNQRLEQAGPISHVIAVHHETTTGRLNDLPGLGAICRQQNIPLLLDTVSSFGGEAIDFEGWNVEACAATANKCLHGAPGISFVLARREVLTSQSSASPSTYLDLFANYKSQIQSVPQFTPAVHVMYALQEALAELKESGGWQHRQQLYQSRSAQVREALARSGVQLLLDGPDCYASSLTSFRLPDEVSFSRLHAHLKQAGFVIYPGQQSLNDTIFRIAVMGDLSNQDIAELVGALDEFFCHAEANYCET